MWELDYKESWPLKNWCFWTVVSRLLRVPRRARRSNQSVLKEISPGCSLEGLILKMKLQYFDHLMRRAGSFERLWCWEVLVAGGEGDDRGWGDWTASLTQWKLVWMNSGSWWCTGRPGMPTVHGVGKSQTWLSSCTEHDSCLHPYLASFISCCCFRVFGGERFWVELIIISYSNHRHNSVEICLFIWLECHNILVSYQVKKKGFKK